MVREAYEPQVRAALALGQHNPAAAVEALQYSARYEGGTYTPPIYLRGLGYLQMHKGAEAAAEF
ncbi:MAG TPA: hypothetical protein VK466_13685 [Terriglobales bacterium]|nr:hypothetical protein [Terriglobales bacterium]